jgi:hypothetical protein
MASVSILVIVLRDPMAFPVPEVWTQETADIIRENKKREASPSSFFCSQGRSICLSAEYFIDSRLSQEARGGVAGKHRHKIQLALFGQLMAAFEYMLKDFFAKTLDATNIFDDKIKGADWLKITTEQLLMQRVVQASIGATLVHPTMGWHSPDIVNSRFHSFFGNKPISGDKLATLSKLWILRHSVAHNAGFVTAHDAVRINQANISERVVNIDADFIKATYEFLVEIASSLALQSGKGILAQWMRSMMEYGSNYERDEFAYVRIKYLGVCETSRTQELPEVTSAMYQQDWNTYALQC